MGYILYVSYNKNPDHLFHIDGFITPLLFISHRLPNTWATGNIIRQTTRTTLKGIIQAASCV